MFLDHNEQGKQLHQDLVQLTKLHQVQVDYLDITAKSLANLATASSALTITPI